jgi:hypothetical protein
MSTLETTPQVSAIVRIEALYQRLTRAKELVAQGKVSPVYGLPEYFIVEGRDTRYLVNGSCNCPDATHRAELLKGNCKHRLAAILYAEQCTTPVPSRVEGPDTSRTTAASSKAWSVPSNSEFAEAAPSSTDPQLERKIAELY